MKFIESSRGRWLNVGMIQVLMKVEDGYYAIMADGEREWISEDDFNELTGGESSGKRVQRPGNGEGVQKKRK